MKYVFQFIVQDIIYCKVVLIDLMELEIGDEMRS